MNAGSDRIFQESILLAIALLEGGNPVIQVTGAGGVGGRGNRNPPSPSAQLLKGGVWSHAVVGGVPAVGLFCPEKQK